jgi:hypothetical protein
MEQSRIRRVSLLYSVFAGIGYGLAFRLLATNSKLSSLIVAMSIAFLFAVPMAIGFIVAWLAAKGGNRGLMVWLGLPLLATSAMLAGTLLLLWEGTICIALMAPIAFLMSVAGGGLGLYFARRRGPTTLACAALLPLLVGPTEAWIGPKWETREVYTSVDIEASVDQVWQNIVRVPLIRPEEQTFSWTQFVGFPRPLQATVNGEGLGSVRLATFAGGVLFVETVTEWQEKEALAFRIKADTASIPPGTLDEHVTVGGQYFDTLRGRYWIEQLEGGRVRLHLSSWHRLSTTFNFYAGFWTDAIMRDVQNGILQVIRNRCESVSRL